MSDEVKMLENLLVKSADAFSGERRRAKAAEAEVRRLKGVLKAIADAPLKPVASDAHLQFNVLVNIARSALEAKP